ncbi:hypothetical protein GCM10009678_32600 [Actinomadura kijaniata]|uniref:DUF11 domain-containing protein n=1 Tax=Actinomadura namibiensis TaxID=182080 RepID=A0A7W3LMU1_ACTNM|nr:hypothetical protein [Actinomadura namibiensis]MBA8950940.1 hypothetical protein [Actinomadura namibiensis]
MRSIVTAHRTAARAVTGALALGGCLLAAPPIQAAAPGKVEFVYTAPKVSRAGDSVTWGWSIRNNGGEPVEKVVLTHRFRPVMKVRSVSARCRVLKDAIRCEYGSLKAGEARSGVIVAEVPATAAGNVQINGRVTWQQRGAAPAPAPAPAPSASPAATGAGKAEAPAEGSAGD